MSIVIFVLATISVALYAISTLFVVKKFALADYLRILAWVRYDNVWINEKHLLIVFVL